MSMYDINNVPMDSPLWQLIAYCAGTGGSLLVIGSAAGVALMGIEKVDFLWYAKKITLAAFVGYMGCVPSSVLSFVSCLIHQAREGRGGKGKEEKEAPATGGRRKK